MGEPVFFSKRIKAKLFLRVQKTANREKEREKQIWQCFVYEAIYNIIKVG